MRRSTLAFVAVLASACKSVGAPDGNGGSVPTSAPTPVTPAAVSARIEPPPSTSAAPLSLPTLASFAATPASDVRWMAAARAERKLQRIALAGTGPVHLVWTRDAPHPDARSGMPVARATLELTRDGRTTRVDAGEIAGEVEPEGSTLCGRLGYRMSNGALLAPPAVDGLVSSLSVGDASGSDELMVVLGPTLLYVLRGQTTDGMCESMTTQGPLTVCRGQEYKRLAEVTLASVAAFDETIRTTTTDDAGTSTAPLDCAAPTMMGTLTPPGAP